MSNPLLKEQVPQIAPQDTTLYQDALEWLAATLKNISLQISDLLHQAQEHNSLGVMLTIIALSFFYGMVHASGPGHGKMLVASYFSANDKSYKKAISLSLAIAVVHTFSALFLTLIAYFLLSSVFATTIANGTAAITKISGLLIIGIGIYLLYNKIKHYRSQKAISKHGTMTQWSTIPIASSCSCASCKSANSTDIALVLSAGLIPCPGTITIFLFSISMGLFYIGFVSAIAMSLGMGFIIAVLSLVSVKFRNSAKSRFAGALKVFEFASLFIIMSLGVLLTLA